MMTYEQRYAYVMKRCAEIYGQREKRRGTAAKIIIPISTAAAIVGVFAAFSGHYPFMSDRTEYVESGDTVSESSPAYSSEQFYAPGDSQQSADLSGDNQDNSSEQFSVPEELQSWNFNSKYEIGTAFEYDGNIYTVMSSLGNPGESISQDMTTGTVKRGYDFAVGVRRETIDGVDTVEFAALVENVGIVPIGLMSSTSSPDKPILFRFEPDDESIDTNNVFDITEFKYMAYVLQPGEKYYQTVSFPVTEAKYILSTLLCDTDPDTFDESKSYNYNIKSSNFLRRRVDFGDRSISFDGVSELSGVSNLSEEALEG